MIGKDQGFQFNHKWLLNKLSIKMETKDLIKISNLPTNKKGREIDW